MGVVTSKSIPSKLLEGAMTEAARCSGRGGGDALGA